MEVARFEALARRAPVVMVGTSIRGRREIRARGEAPGSDPVFEIGSVTKTFTALLFAEMCERGEVSPTDPLAKFVPTLSGGARDITLSELATHHAGLPKVPRDLLWQAVRAHSDPYAGYEQARLESALGHARVKRGRFRYSNLGFAALGHALAIAGGTAYEDLVAERICEPLGLTSTTTIAGERDLAGHKRIGKPVPDWELASFGPAGALRSSVEDLLTYLEAHLDPGGPLAGPLEEVQKPRVQIRKDRLAIGWSWLILTRRGRTVAWHGGGTGGFSSFVGFDRDRGVALVALANARVASPLTRAGARTLEEL